MRPQIEVQAEDRPVEASGTVLSIRTTLNSPQSAQVARDALLRRFHEKRNAFIDIQNERPLNSEEQQEFADLRCEIDRWQLIDERERQGPLVRDLSDLTERILGIR